MTTFYAAAALTNAVIDRELGSLARPVICEVLSELGVANQLPTWVEWTINLIRNNVQVGDPRTSLDDAHANDLGERLALMLSAGSDNPVLRSQSALAAICNCLAWVLYYAHKSDCNAVVKSIANEFVQCDGDIYLALLLDGPVGFYSAQALCLFYGDHIGLKPKRRVLDKVLRCYQSEPTRSDKKGKLARVILSLSEGELRRTGLERTSLIEATSCEPSATMGLSKLSLADSG